MKTVELKYNNPFSFKFRFGDGYVITHPVQKIYFVFGTRAVFHRTVTPMSMPGLTIHHSFFSAN